MRILHVSQPTEAGVALIVRQLVADQIGRAWDLHVACPGGRGRLAAEVRESGAVHHEWRAGRAPGMSVAGEISRLGRIVRSVEPDVVHLHSSKAGLAGRLAVRGRLPTVFEPNGWSFLVGGAVGALALRWERLADRWCDVIVCVSAGERDVGTLAGIGSRHMVVPNAVDLGRFPPATAADRSGARARLGLSAGPLVVCVGRLSRQKGQDVLLEAWPSVTARVPEARLVLVGAGPDEKALAEQAGEDVRLVGHREDVPDWLAAADVIAQPSRWEGMSLVLLQAMARGRSVVSTDVAGAQELLSDGAGGVVAIEDADSLGDALAERLLDPARAAAEGEVGRRIAERHDVRGRAERIAGLYADVLERRATAARL